MWLSTFNRDQCCIALLCYRNNCVNRSPVQYGCFAGAKAIQYRVNIALSFRKKTNNWASTVAGVLSSGCPQFFKSGQKEFNKETGWWALQDNVAPAVKFSEQGLFLLYLFIAILLNENNKKWQFSFFNRNRASGWPHVVLKRSLNTASKKMLNSGLSFGQAALMHILLAQSHCLLA